jgi:hypothetical protein
LAVGVVLVGMAIIIVLAGGVELSNSLYVVVSVVIFAVVALGVHPVVDGLLVVIVETGFPKDVQTDIVGSAAKLALLEPVGENARDVVDDLIVGRRVLASVVVV